MLIVNYGHPDTPFEITPYEIPDGHGGVIENPPVHYRIESSNENAVAIQFSDDGLGGTLQFKGTGLAIVQVVVSDQHGRILDCVAKTFMVVRPEEKRVELNTLDLRFPGLKTVSVGPDKAQGAAND